MLATCGSFNQGLRIKDGAITMQIIENRKVIEEIIPMSKISKLGQEKQLITVHTL